jgi:hypothetical protein
VRWDFVQPLASPPLDLTMTLQLNPLARWMACLDRRLARLEELMTKNTLARRRYY